MNQRPLGFVTRILFGKMLRFVELVRYFVGVVWDSLNCVGYICLRSVAQATVNSLTFRYRNYMDPHTILWNVRGTWKCLDDWIHRTSMLSEWTGIERSDVGNISLFCCKRKVIFLFFKCSNVALNTSVQINDIISWDEVNLWRHLAAWLWGYEIYVYWNRTGPCLTYLLHWLVFKVSLTYGQLLFLILYEFKKWQSVIQPRTHFYCYKTSNPRLRR